MEDTMEQGIRNVLANRPFFTGLCGTDDDDEEQPDLENSSEENTDTHKSDDSVEGSDEVFEEEDISSEE